MPRSIPVHAKKPTPDPDAADAENKREFKLVRAAGEGTVNFQIKWINEKTESAYCAPRVHACEKEMS